MKLHPWSDLKKERLSKARLAEIEEQIEAEVLEMNLTALREAAGKTQAEVAKAIGSGQSEVSRSERREDHLVSNLRSFVEALGGELKLIARFNDKSVRLRGV